METFTEEQQQFTLKDESIDYWTFIKKESTKSLEAIETTLQDLGLSKNEIQVYLYLSFCNGRKASEISEALNLHRTNTYQILHDLEKKGLVSSTLEKPLKFIATPFEKAINVLIEAKKLSIQKLESKKKNLIDTWLSLPKPKIEGPQKEIFQILEGDEQIALKIADAIQNAQKEIALFVSENDLPLFYNSGLMEKLEARSKLDIKLLADNSSITHFFIEKTQL
ncbi:MAG: helix-turn-helix domain-containing protein, partial [Candidatus Bathyarchaeia archaeon]